MQAVSTLYSAAQPQSLSLACAEKTSSSWALLVVPNVIGYSETPWNVGNRSSDPGLSGALLHRGFGGAFPKLHGNK